MSCSSAIDGGSQAGELPSLKEIELLLKLERQVETQETLERLNALTREAK